MTSALQSVGFPSTNLQSLLYGNRSQGVAKASSLAPKKVVKPDLFVSFVAQRPRPNPYYEEVKRESEEWMKELCHWTEREYRKHVLADFPYFAAVWATEASKEEFRTIVDWCNWVFDFDDYRHTTGAQRRFIKSMTGFFSGLVGQVDVRSTASVPDIERYLALSRESIGVYPCLALVEYFHALDIPDEVFENPYVREIEKLAADIVLLQNDILSFHKEQSMGANHNIVHLYRQRGISQQDAYNRVSELLNQRYRRWYIAHSNVPLWGEQIDTQVQLYLKGCQDVILGNL